MTKKNYVISVRMFENTG